MSLNIHSYYFIYSFLFNSLVCVFSKVHVTDEVREYLRKPTFDNWQWDESEMLILLRQMFIDLGFVTRFNIEVGINYHRFRI